MRLRQGDIVADRYRVTRHVDDGGQGHVYQCCDVFGGCTVALKRARDDGALAGHYYYREALALAALRHENLVALYDVDRDEDARPYVVTEYVHGWRLATGGRVPLVSWPLLAELTDQLLLALAHVHARGLVHLDVKPDNLLVEDCDGWPVVRLVDFGIAHLTPRLEAAARERVAADGLAESTKSETPSAGTLPYAAPEQLGGARFGDVGFWRGPATDLFAVGVVLFEASTGTALLSDQQANEVTYGELLTGSAALPQRLWHPANGAPAALWPLVEQLTAVHPWRRPPSAAIARDQLRRCRAGGDDHREAVRQAWAALLPELRRTPAPQPCEIDPQRARPVRPPLVVGLSRDALVGRHDGRAALSEHALAARRGERRAVVVCGAAGMGKSRLVRWLAERAYEAAEDDGGAMVVCRVRVDETRRGLDAVLAAIERDMQLEGAPTTRAARNVLRARLGDAGAAADTLARLLVPQRFAVTPPLTVDLLLRALRGLAGGRALLLCVDDLSLAAPELLALVEALLDGDGDGGVLVAAALSDGRGVAGAADERPADERPAGERPADERAAAARAALLRRADCAKVTLDPLDAATVAELVNQHADLEPAALEALTLAARGSPASALSYLQALVSDPDGDDVVWQPAQRRYRVASKASARLSSDVSAEPQRVARLPRDAAQALFALSVLGRELPVALVAPMLAAVGDGGERGAESQLDVLIGAGLLTLDSAGASYAFGQISLLAWIERAEAAAPARRAAAEALVQLVTGRARPGPVDTRALLRASRVLGRDDQAADALLADLERRWPLRRDGRRALADLALLQDERGGWCAEQRAAELYHWQAEAFDSLNRDAETTEAAALAEAALDAAPRRDDESELALRAALQRLRGQAAAGLRRYDAAAQHLGHALALYEQLGSRADARVGEIEARTRLARLLWMAGAQADSRTCYQRASALAAEVDSPFALAACDLGLGFVACTGGELDEARRLADAARRRFRSPCEDDLGVAQTHFLAGWAHLHASALGEAGALEAAERESAEATRGFERQADWWWSACAQLLGAWVALARGDQSEAGALARHAGAAFDAHDGMDHERDQTRVFEAAAALNLGDAEAAARALAPIDLESVGEPMLVQPARLARAWLASVRGETDAARASLEGARAVDREAAVIGWGAPLLLARLLDGALAAQAAAWRDELATRAPSTRGE